MKDKYAVRNLNMCEKDCLCLYVCPTGAADTENSIIDKDKCIGCGACADACPTKAISMMPRELPPQQKKNEDVIKSLRRIILSKAKQEAVAAELSSTLALAVEKSNRLMAEDLYREAGYMLPQSENTENFLKSLLEIPDVPKGIVNDLLNSINFNEKKA